MKRIYKRRDFLRYLGLSAAVAPFLPYLDRFAEATGGTFPNRLLLTFGPNGTIESRFWPSGTETQFTFPAGQITEVLAPFQPYLIFPKGLTRTKPGGGGPHQVAMANLYTGASYTGTGANGPSIDQIIAGKLPKQTPFQTLALSVQHNEQIGGDLDPASRYMTYLAANQPVLPDDDPYHVFSSLMFPMGTGPNPGMDQLRAQRKSVLDLVLGELQVVDKNVDAADRAKIDAHITGIRDLEMRLQNVPPMGGGGSCAAPTLQQGLQGLLYDNDSFPALLKMQTDLMVAALACDQTRIASLQWSRTFSMIRHTWLDPAAPPHHTNSHDGSAPALDWQYRMSYWYAKQMVDLLTKMQAVKEGNETLLDHSLVVWSYDMNLGLGHILPPHIAVLAGKLGGKMNTGTNGRFIDYNGQYDWTQMLVTICQAMGANDVNTVGDMGVAGAIPGLLN